MERREREEKRKRENFVKQMGPVFIPFIKKELEHLEKMKKSWIKSGVWNEHTKKIYSTDKARAEKELKLIEKNEAIVRK